MKTLFLLRHADSDAAARGQADFDRPLNIGGRQAALAMGRELRRLGLAAERILASPAARVVQTLEQIAQGYGGRMAIDYRPNLYLAAPETLLGAVRAADDAQKRLLLAGHNPGLQLLALRLAGDGLARPAIEAGFPAGALVEIALPVARWAEVIEGQGSAERFISPSDLEAGS